MNPEFITQLEPPVSLRKSEPLAVIKIEPPESEFVENESEIKYIDIVSHTLCEAWIKSEGVPENAPFVKTESETLYETGATSDGQEMVEVQGDLETEHPEKTANQTVKTTSWQEVKGKIKVIKGPVIPIKPHEYKTLAKNKHVCKHCQHTCNKLTNLKYHIRKVHRKSDAKYQCPYCSFKSKLRSSLPLHIIDKHKDPEDTQWFPYHCDKCDYKTYNIGYLRKHKIVHLEPEKTQYFYCYHCSYKAKRKASLKNHIFTHFKNVQTKQNRKRYACDKCYYTTVTSQNLKLHKLNHLKPEEIEYFYCDHCSYKAKRKGQLKGHMVRHLENVEIKQKRYNCDRCDYEASQYAQMKRHEMTHLKPEEIPYFYCYHCPYKAKQKGTLKCHISKHFRNGEVLFQCYICEFVALERESIIGHIKKHPKIKIEEF